MYIPNIEDFEPDDRKVFLEIVEREQKKGNDVTEEDVMRRLWLETRQCSNDEGVN